jgi:hypothetical protein
MKNYYLFGIKKQDGKIKTNWYLEDDQVLLTQLVNSHIKNNFILKSSIFTKYGHYKTIICVNL